MKPLFSQREESKVLDKEQHLFFVRKLMTTLAVRASNRVSTKGKHVQETVLAKAMATRQHSYRVKRGL